MTSRQLLQIIRRIVNCIIAQYPTNEADSKTYAVACEIKGILERARINEN